MPPFCPSDLLYQFQGPEQLCLSLYFSPTHPLLSTIDAIKLLNLCQTSSRMVIHCYFNLHFLIHDEAEPFFIFNSDFIVYDCLFISFKSYFHWLLTFSQICKNYLKASESYPWSVLYLNILQLWLFSPRDLPVFVFSWCSNFYYFSFYFCYITDFKKVFPAPGSLYCLWLSWHKISLAFPNLGL